MWFYLTALGDAASWFIAERCHGNNAVTGLCDTLISDVYKGKLSSLLSTQLWFAISSVPYSFIPLLSTLYFLLPLTPYFLLPLWPGEEETRILAQDCKYLYSYLLSFHSILSSFSASSSHPFHRLLLQTPSSLLLFAPNSNPNRRNFSSSATTSTLNLLPTITLLNSISSTLTPLLISHLHL